MRLTVGTGSVDATKALLNRFRLSYVIRTAAGKATFLIANPGERSGDDYPLARELPAALDGAGIGVIALRLP